MSWRRWTDLNAAGPAVTTVAGVLVCCAALVLGGCSSSTPSATPTSTAPQMSSTPVGTGGSIGSTTTLGSTTASSLRPTLVVSPPTNLHDGTTVSVAGAGFAPGETVQIGQCRTEVHNNSGCTFEPSAMNVIASHDGTFTIAVKVHRRLDLIASTFDCAAAFDACELAIYPTDATTTPYAHAPLRIT